MTTKAPASSTERRLCASAAEWEALIDELVERWIGEGLVQFTGWAHKPLLQTPLPPKVVDAWFDVAAVERVLKFFLLLEQQIGRWAGVPFKLLDWQVKYEIAPVFGWKHPDGLRIVRTVWDEKPRKNGKSTEASGLGLFLLCADGEHGGEVYAAAGDKDQARIVFGASSKMAQGSRSLMRRVNGKPRVRALRSVLEYPSTGSIFRVLSSAADTKMGLNVHGGFVDEVHIHKTPDLIDTLETGTGSRDQPIIWFITTADDGKIESVYAIKREYAENVAHGTIDDPTFYAIIFAAPEELDPFAESTLEVANPGIDFTVKRDYLLRKAKEAQSTPALTNRYLRLHLNQRTQGLTRWLTIGRYDAAAGLVTDGDWAGRQVFGGLDLSTTTDLTAFVFDADDGEGAIVRPMFWLPEERAEILERKHRLPFARWAKEGFLTLTEGNVVDYDRVVADILREEKRLGCKLGEIGYDEWNATQTVIGLEKLGYTCKRIPQTYSGFSAAMKEIERLVEGSTSKRPLYRHSGNPILRWNVDVVQVRQDDNENMRPVKPERHKTAARIDGIVAAIMARSRSMNARAEVKKSKVMGTR